MKYNKNKTYKIYTRGLTKGEIQTRLYEQLGIFFEEYPIGMSSRGSGEISWDRLVDYNDGMLLSGIGDDNPWNDGWNILLYIDKGRYDDGHLESHGVEVIGVDLRRPHPLSPVTVCQSHTFGVI
jgi:hypothetical protein